MPSSESGYYDSNDARKNSEQDVVHRHERLAVVAVVQDLRPDPSRRRRKGYPTEECQVDQEEEEGLVVVKPDACGQPRAMVVHLEHAPPAGGAVVGTVRFLCLTLLAEPNIAGRRLDCEGGILHAPSLLRRKLTIAICDVERRAGIGEYSGGIAPVEHHVQEEAERGGGFACAMC